MVMLRYSGGSQLSGYSILTDPDVGTKERETVKCCHCQMIWEVEPGSGKKRGFCFNCNAVVCGKKRCMEHCVPFEKAIEAAERRPDGTIIEWFEVGAFRDGEPVDFWPNDSVHPGVVNRETFCWVGRESIPITEAFEESTGRVLTSAEKFQRRLNGQPIPHRPAGTKRGADFRGDFFAVILRRIQKAEAATRANKRISEVTDDEIEAMPAQKPPNLQSLSIDEAVDELVERKR